MSPGQAALKSPLYGVQPSALRYGHADGLGVAEDDALEVMTGVPVDNEEDATKLEIVLAIAEDELLSAGAALHSLRKTSEVPGPV